MKSRQNSYIFHHYKYKIKYYNTISYIKKDLPKQVFPPYPFLLFPYYRPNLLITSIAFPSITRFAVLSA